MSQAAVKRRIRLGQPTFGSWLTLGHAPIAEILAQAGYEWLTIDLEHSSIDFAEVHRMIQVIELTGCSPLVRVSENSAAQIKRVLDMGAHGIIVPMVNSADDARAMVNAVRYPPVGTRGVGLGRAQGYGADFEGYRSSREKQTIVIAQIEHRDGVEHLDEILDVKGIDAVLVGPYDLSASLGVPGDFEHPLMRGAMARIRTIAKARRVAAGLHVIRPEPKLVQAALRDGFTVIVYCFDAMFLGETARQGLAEIRARMVPGRRTPTGRAHRRSVK
jgi:2-dehydro-3-deoxyglucarate aldolase